MNVSITIHGPLQGKGRPRFPRGGGKPYTPEPTRRYEAMIQVEWLLTHGKRMDGPLAVRIIAYQALPKRASKLLRAAAERGEIWPIRKPDIDNVIKIALDALNGYAYKDDTQIVRIDAEKRYTQYDESRLEITVGRVDDGHGA